MSKFKTYLLKKIYKSLYKPGHFYSTIPDISEVQHNRGRIFAHAAPHGIDLKEENQREFLESMRSTLADFNWPAQRSSRFRYFSDNSFFNRTDARILFGMIKKFGPAKIVEIGSGFSTALMIDINENHFNNSIQITCIEPYPDRLKNLMRPEDIQSDKYNLIIKTVQEVPLAKLIDLKENDILFVDSSHVSKVGSDLNHILFSVLPLLQSGVINHFHDIMYPFEYPEDWIMQGIYWNEAYLLRAFLMYNSMFEVFFMNDFWTNVSISDMEPLNSGGGLWLKKSR